jgi:hypothetical protein
MAQDLGLHRDPAGWMNAFPVLKFSTEEVEVRRRTWWAVYIVDKYVHEECADLKIHIRLARPSDYNTESGV